MRYGINLRGDLAKLPDEELAARFEASMDERERLAASISNLLTSGNKRLYQKGWRAPFG
jgi:hypothetical protein